MRTRLIVALIVAVSALLLACGPTAQMADIPSGNGSPLAPAALEWTQAGDDVTGGRMITVASTPEPGRGAGGSVKQPGSAPEDVFEFRSHTAWITEDGGIDIVGEVVNVSDEVVDTMVSVAVALADVDGNTVGGDFGAYLDRPVIAPGEKSSFWIPIYADELGDVSADDISDYELTLWVSEDPSMEVELSINSADGGEDDGYFVIAGEVENQTDLTFDVLFVYSTLYDAGGEVINATVDWVFPDEPLAPGETADFEGYFYDHFEDADSFYVFVTGYGSPVEGEDGEAIIRLASADDVLQFISHAGFFSDYGGINVVGEVQNISDEDVDTAVRVEVQLLDEDGNPLLSPFVATLDRPVLAPGNTSSFWVPIYEEDLGEISPDDISDYVITAWISDRESPGVELTVSDLEGGEEGDVFLIQGTVLNETDQEFDWLVVYSTLYDTDGSVVNATADWIDLDEPLAPGEETEFEGYFPERFEDTDSFAVIAVGYSSDDPTWDFFDTATVLKEADDIFDVTSHSGFETDYGFINIVGEAQNISDVAVDTLVLVEVQLYDADDEPMSDQMFTALLDRPYIGAGEYSSFWVPVNEVDLGDATLDDVSSYEIFLWVSDMPSTEVELTVGDVGAGEEDGNFVIWGTVQNQTDMEFTALRVYSTLYDESGEVLNVTGDWIELDEPLRPGEEAEFEGYFPDNFEDADSYYVFVTGYGGSSDDSGLSDAGEVLEIVSDAGFLTQYGDISIVGEAVNVGDETIDTVVVVEVRLYDEDGNVMGDGEMSAYLDRPVIEPGEVSSFWVPIASADLGDYTVDDVDDYDITFWVTDEPSPDVELTVEDYDGGIEDDIFYVWGTVSNQTDLDIGALAVYSTLYDEDGNVVNATLDWIELDEPLQPGEETEFEGYFPEQFEDADSFYVFVSGYSVEQLGW